MQTVTSTTTIIQISPADITAYVTGVMSELLPANCVLQQRAGGFAGRPFGKNSPSPTILNLTWPVSAAELDTFLRTIIPNLPVIGSYSVNVVRGKPNVAAEVTWAD